MYIRHCSDTSIIIVSLLFYMISDFEWFNVFDIQYSSIQKLSWVFAFLFSKSGPDLSSHADNKTIFKLYYSCHDCLHELAHVQCLYLLLRNMNNSLKSILNAQNCTKEPTTLSHLRQVPMWNIHCTTHLRCLQVK